MVKEKRRNSERRKEKSRDAARCRRSKETEIFNELAQCLPLPECVALQLDKASVMRLAISQLKIDDVLGALGIADADLGHRGKLNGNGVLTKNEKGTSVQMTEGQANPLYLKALEGMMVVLSHDGDVVFVSENVAKYLGLQQIEVVGQSIYDYIHPCDHEEIKDALNMKSGGPQEQPKAENGDDSLMYGEIGDFSLRMKCTLTTKGRGINIKSAPYKVMNCCGRLVSSPKGQNDEGSASRPYLLAMMEPIPHPSNIEVPLDSSTFLSKHEMDMRFVFCDDRIEELAGFDHKAMIGQSFFDFHHALDSDAIKKTFKDLFSKGQAVTPAYRMLAANGGYIWLVTQATTINNGRNQKPTSVVCVHYVLSGVEEKGAILSCIQELLALSSTPPLTPATVSAPVSPRPGTTPAVTLVASKLLPQLDLLPPKVELITESIFAPRTKEMDEGFCRPPPFTQYVSDDPEDMDCLSPAPGEENVPFYLKAYKKEGPISPMLSMTKSPAPLSPATLSPAPSVPSLLSPGQWNSLTPVPSPYSNFSSNECSRVASPDDYLSCTMPLEMDTMDTFLASINTRDDGDKSISNNNNNTNNGRRGNLQLPGIILTAPVMEEVEEVEDIDFAQRAPYIPMDGDQDLDLLPPSSSNLFNLSKDDINPSVFGHTEYVFGPKHGLFEEPKPTPKVSVRDMLGESTVVASIEQPEGTMYLQMKRPLDMNCLEKGPPAPKVAKLEETVVLPAPSQPCQAKEKTVTVSGTKKNSVLLNLLLNGEDIDSGYRVNQTPFSTNRTSEAKKSLLSNTFDSLTSRDCEVNAPITSCQLLQGQELLKALERI